MSASFRSDYHPDDPTRYAQRWIREARLRAATAGGRSPGPESDAAGDAPADEPMGPMPRDLDESPGPPLAPWRRGPEFEGDVAIKQMREARAFEPDIVPEPCRRGGPGFTLAMFMRAAGAVTVATVGALVYVGAVPLSVPAPLQDVIASLGRKAAVTPGRPATTEKTAKMPGRVGDDGAVGRSAETPVGTPSADPVPNDTVRAVKTVTVAPWPTAVAPAPAAPPPPAQTVRRLDPEEVDTLIRRGEAFILQGDFAAARLMLQRAAEAGSGRAAVMLGATYDPVMLRKVGVVGLKPEPELAREWYERAVALGSSEASARIAELGSN